MVPSSPDTQAPREVLAGSVERVTYHNAENGFCVLRIKVRGYRDLVTVVGHAPSVSAGEWVTATGAWVNDRRHGPQFRADHLRVAAPSSAEGIERFLASGMIKGIGPVYGHKLVQAFGEEVFEVIEQTPERLREVAGIGPKRAQRIIDGWHEQKVIREIMMFLHSHGVGTARAVRIYKTYGVDAVAQMSENPYRLARDIRGIGFKSADAIAMRLGVEHDALMRVRAGIAHVLLEATDQGHCGLPAEELVPEAVALLEVEQARVREALRYELEAGELIEDTLGQTRCVFLASLYRAEDYLARRLVELSAGPPSWPWIDAEQALPWVEARTGLALAEHQGEAARRALASKVTVITGGPGVGKTTLVNTILAILAAKGVAMRLCAPTGRAAKRMSEATGREARTIHRLLEVDPSHGGFRHDEENPLACELLVLDEASMVDVRLMQALVRALPDRAALLIVGDIDQLPSVGPGQVLADVIHSEALPVVRLSEVFRQAARSRIVTNAHRINQGRIPDLERPEGESDFYFVETDEPEAAVERILYMVTRRIPERFGLDPVDDVQVLCPMNRGSAGARSLNLALQQALNPVEDRDAVERFGWRFARGDKVMQTQNDYDKEVYNGDMGRVESVDMEEQELTACFEGRSVVYGFDELDGLVPGYAATIHKAQGSEYPAVIIPVLTQHYPMLRRNLLYTGVTRGRRLVVLVGQRKAVVMAARSGSSRGRWTRLRELLAKTAEAVDAPAPQSTR